jgi:hypothetical protein
MPVFPAPETTVPAFAGTVFIYINKKRIYFFLAAFFLPPFFFADFLALVAIVISLHVELVRAQYIHKLKMASKRCMRNCCSVHITLITQVT